MNQNLAAELSTYNHPHASHIMLVEFTRDGRTYKTGAPLVSGSEDTALWTLYDILPETQRCTVTYTPEQTYVMEDWQEDHVVTVEETCAIIHAFKGSFEAIAKIYALPQDGGDDNDGAGLDETPLETLSDEALHDLVAETETAYRDAVMDEDPVAAQRMENRLDELYTVLNQRRDMRQTVSEIDPQALADEWFAAYETRQRCLSLSRQWNDDAGYLNLVLQQRNGANPLAGLPCGTDDYYLDRMEGVCETYGVQPYSLGDDTEVEAALALADGMARWAFEARARWQVKMDGLQARADLYTAAKRGLEGVQS